jgi:preprotein translocase subunit SecE
MARSPGLPGRVGARAARRSINFRFVTEAAAELRRVTWPTRQETMRLTIMVIVVAASVGIFLGIIDLGFARLFDLLLEK